jgi:hypothetical protein
MRLLWKLATHNLGWKILALGVSYLLWLTLVAQPELSTVKSLPVLYKNLPPGASLAGGAPEMVRVELRGTQSSLSSGNLSDSVLTLDLDGVAAGATHTFAIEQSELKLPQSVQFIRADPPQIQVKLTPLAAKPDNRK